MMAACADGAVPGQALESLGGFDQMVVFEIAVFWHLVLPHVVGNLVSRPGCGQHGLGIQLADAPGRKNRGVYAVAVEQFEEAPDAHASPELAFGELHGGFVAHTP